MASSEPVDESFRSRVDKIFGSLSSSSLRPPWSLTGDEVEKREWKRDKHLDNRDDQTPCSSSFDGLFKKDRKILGKKWPGVPGDPNDDDVGDDKDEWDIRSSIGLDCTLDNEEEEDEYDKLAEGRENAGDRIYMRDVTDHGPYVNSHNVLPNAVHDAPRDPRANYYAAQNRLKEDEPAAEKFDSNQTCDKSMLNAEEPCNIASEVGVKLRSILKRKNNATFKSLKRVRFDPACKDDYEEASEKHQDFWTGTPLMGTKASGDGSLLTENRPRVPDYVLNPSKYVRYSFDSSGDIDEESNSQACMDFLEPIKRSKSILLEQKLEDASADFPKSVMFIPRKKTADAKAVINSSEVKENHGDGPKQSLTQAGFAVGIAAEEVQQSELAVIGDVSETDPAGRRAGFKKQGRRYRTKASLEDTIS